MTGWVILGVGAVLVGAGVLARIGKHRRLFADEHFMEVAQAASRLKQAALADLQFPSPVANPGDDPRALLTGRGLAVVYTVVQQEQQYVHHCSVSLVDGVTANAIGGTFLIFAATFLGLPADAMTYQIGASTVHHGELVVGAEDHAAIASRPVPAASLENVQAIRLASFNARRSLAWHSSRTPPTR